MSQKVYYPLTSPQLSIWYTEQMFPGTSISNVAGTLRIQENVDFSLLEKAIQLFIKNNDGIRLRLCLDENGNPQQYVSEYLEKPVPFIDFTTYEDPAKAFYDWNTKMTLKPFELLNKDLYSFTMVKISDTDGGFYIITHHSISDAWNMSLIGSFIVDYYCKLKNGITDKSAFLPKPSYLSFIENDIAYKSSNRYEKDKHFWDQKFDAIPEATVLKTRKTSLFSAKSNRKTFVAPPKFINKLKEYCREYKVTPYPLFMSALCMYIFRVTGKEDIVLGTPILNRLNHSDKNTSGMFISTIPLRIGINAEEQFLGLCERVQEACSASYRHQRFPYDQILRFVRNKHDTKENLYDIVLSYQNTKFDKSYEVDYITRWHFNGYQPNSLTIHINDRDDEDTIIIDYDYHEDLYYDKEIEFLHQHFLSLLWHALDDPHKVICKIEMLPESEKKKVLYDFNKTEMEYPREKLIHQLFEEQVERTPDNVAVIFEDKSMTYRELNERANQLARVLRRKGVQRDAIVGIMVPRSFELITGILAILKAGGAFMTIEPDYPEERIKYMLENSKVSILLTSGNSYAHGSTEKIDIFDKTLYDKESDKNLEYINTSGDLVYVIYTSGTTGNPKGVMIEHKSLHNFVCCMTKEFSYHPSSVVLSVASICFDLFIMEFMPAILSGAKLVLANEEQRNLPSRISKLIEENSITDILFTPSRMKLLVDDENYNNCLINVKHIMLGGEKLEHQLVKKLNQLTKAYILNAYGPTESTIAATFKHVTDYNRISIGKPIGNTKVFILDGYNNPVPVGIQGNLCISGECLARGYVNNPELTAKMFIESPFDNKKKLYKTGDMARWYPEGDIEFLGRIDKQVKLRGYRIELSEIENELMKYPGVRDAAVDIKKSLQGEYICAYYVSETKIETKQLRSFLEKQLPKYMIPKFMAQVNNIPLNSNGKKDLKQLTDINPNIEYEESIREPQNDTEEKLVKIISNLLNINQLSTASDFFELGADSLTVIKLISVLDREGYQISVEDVYRNPTVRDLSNLLTSRTVQRNEEAVRDYHSNMALKSANNIPPIDSAAISYIPSGLPDFPPFDEPVFLCSMQLHLGNIGLFVLPITENQLYCEKEKLITLCGKAINQASDFGAKVVSLTGLIPAVTNYGNDIIGSNEKSIQITTGQATTTAAILLTLEKILFLCGSMIYGEQISIIGLDDIGLAFTELLLHKYPNIGYITLCNTSMTGKHDKVISNIKNNYNGDIKIIHSKANYIPSEAYNASVIIGTSNIPNIINVEQLNPGTILIDYSIPHSFSKEKAIERILEKNDIIFSDGGTLYPPEPIKKSFYVSETINMNRIDQIYHSLTNPQQITGCILSSLLVAKNNHLTPIRRQVELRDSLSHYQALIERKFSGSILQYDNYEISQQQANIFYKKYRRGFQSSF